MNQRKLGVVLSYAGQIVNILTGLIYTPVMLRFLGQSEYGLYQLVFSVVSYLSLLSLGFGASYMRFYSIERANKNEDGIAKLNGMFMLVFCSISIICIVCGIVMVENIRLIFETGLTDTEYQTARILMTLMVVNLVLSFPNSVFNCIVTSQEKFVFQKVLILLQHLANPFLSIPLLIMGYGSIGMVVVTTFLTVCVLFTNIYYCIVKLNSKFRFGGFETRLLKEMATFTFFIFLNQIIDQINWSVDKYLLGRISGTAIVAIYSVGAQINTLYLQLSTSISGVFIPQVNKIVAETNDNEALTKLFIKVGRVQCMLMMLIVTGFIYFGQDFLRFWAGNGYNDAYYVTLLLIIPVTIPLIQNIGIEIQRAKNKHRTRSIVYFFIAIANIIISIPLIRHMGPVGAALGTAISLVIGNGLFMNWYYYARIGINIPLFWKNVIKFVPSILISSIFGITSLIYIKYDSIMTLIFGMIVYSAIFLLSLYFTGMNEEEKKWIIMPIAKLRMKSNLKD